MRVHCESILEEARKCDLLTFRMDNVVNGSEVDLSHTYLKQRNKISLQRTNKLVKMQDMFNNSSTLLY